jgi:predicted Zn-dependent peptidase
VRKSIRTECLFVVVAERLSSGIQLLTESMPHVRSISLGIWLLRGSRHESDDQSGIAHFVEHMLFKGTANRTAQQIAQEIDSIGGQLDAFTAKEYAGYYIKVLDEHLPTAVDLLSDMILRPAFGEDEILREQGVILEEIKMVEDAPDDLVHEIFAQQFWPKHPLGRPILGTPATVSSFGAAGLRAYFDGTYVAPRMLVAAAGNIRHEQLRDLIERMFAPVPAASGESISEPPDAAAGSAYRQKDIEQSHVCLGVPAYHQAHQDRHALYVLNTILGGSMSSRLFQHIREDRGLAYAVFSTLTTYSDAGVISIYAGCASDRVPEVVDLALAELRGLREVPVPAEELRRAKDHLKGSLVLNLESTSSRMSNLARQHMFFGRYFTLDELTAAIEAVTTDDVQRVAHELFADQSLTTTVVGPAEQSPLAGELRV